MFGFGKNKKNWQETRSIELKQQFDEIMSDVENLNPEDQYILEKGVISLLNAIELEYEKPLGCISIFKQIGIYTNSRNEGKTERQKGEIIGYAWLIISIYTECLTLPNVMVSNQLKDKIGIFIGKAMSAETNLENTLEKAAGF